MNRVLRWTPWIFVLAWLGALSYYLPGTVNHDSAWSLYSTGRWLDGARFYVDMVEINPPLNFYLHVPPVLLSRWTGLGLMPSFVLWIFAMVAASLSLCVRMTREAREDDPGLWTLLLLGALIASLAVPRGSFGQREHIVVVLAFGYFFCAALRASGRPVRRGPAAVAGLLAALGLALKPYFVLVPLLLELREIVRHRSIRAAIRPDSIVLVSVGILYGMSVPLVHPEYLRDVVPLALATYSLGFGVPLRAFLVQGSTLLLVGLLLCYLVARPAMKQPRVNDTFWLAALGFFGAYVWQMKGFPYHTGPVMALVLVALLPLAAGGPLVGDRGLLEPWQRIVAFLGVVVIG
ncbi:MAG: hypothetical protein Q8W45_08510, partial [Candidatus Palauibacterales bacterium]|nr:hypothetical protein [Candidatus Palauibacterales bacterium]